ncbi:PIN domain-containing protein [Thermofilum pendens]|uniref:Ribonuclease VapC n=1 Tax=Thermofilum pendens (strain DSM 2475 / Hrk 5) TaxID=368408 RepID=A1S094_THEPD|nr:PIN domain-containing protein [Thermofilum pendens]ABL78874.1 PilT protein domain protein [Thermofilum pendens Hrk 5]
MSRKARVALDTSVIVEYIDARGDLHRQAELVFSALLSGRLEALIPHPVLAETYYVAARLYRALGAGDPEGTASRLVSWLYRLPSVSVPEGGVELAVEAGRVKARYGVALTDCYVLAVARVYACKALFKRPEGEMAKHLDELRREYGAVFLEDYA